MAKRVEKDGQLYWQFSNLPYNVGEKVRALYNYYMRTDPQTGVFHGDKWAVYPNHSTPRTLGPLLLMLQAITHKNEQALGDHPALEGPIALIAAEHERFKARLAFYQSQVASIGQAAPDVSVGGASTASKQLARYVVEPLFLGWYPNETPPFSEQPPPYSSQADQATLDLYTPFSIANQLSVHDQAIDDAYEQLKADLAENANVTFTEILPVLPALNVLPFVAAGAIGLAIYSWLGKPG